MSKPKAYVAFDIEKTGKYDNDKDPLFAVGFVVGTYSIEAHANHEGFMSLTPLHKIVEKYSCALNLHKPANTSWLNWWEYKSYEMRCYTEFWSKHEDKLNELQDPTKIKLLDTEEEFVGVIVRILTEIEEKYEVDSFVLDTVLFDSVHLSALLMKYGHQPVNYTRSGRQYIQGYEVDSWVHGICGSSDYNKKRAFKNYVLKYYMPEIGDVQKDHNPANDATNIMAVFLGCVNYCEFRTIRRERGPIDDKLLASMQEAKNQITRKKQEIASLESMLNFLIG